MSFHLFLFPRLRCLASITAEPASETSVPLAEPEDEDQIEDAEKPEGAWAHEWTIMAHRLMGAGMTLSLPVPDGEKYFAPLSDVLPFAPSVAPLYRYIKTACSYKSRKVFLCLSVLSMGIARAHANNLPCC